MKAVLAHLLVMMLLGQALTGWCWRCADESLAFELTETIAAPKCCCQPEPDRHESEHDSNCPRDCQGICTFLTAPAVHLDFSPAAFTAATYLSAVDVCSPPAVQCTGVNDCYRASPPERLHILHQLLLI